MLIDGVTEGSVRAIDPLIASQLLVSSLNSAYDLRDWIQNFPQEKTFAFIGSTLAFGLFADPPAPRLG